MFFYIAELNLYKQCVDGCLPEIYTSISKSKGPFDTVKAWPETYYSRIHDRKQPQLTSFFVYF